MRASHVISGTSLISHDFTAFTCRMPSTDSKTFKGHCKDEADVMELLKDFECNAIDWDKVGLGFSENLN